MTLILSIETSTSVCSVALHEDGNLISHREIDQEQAHASRLAPFVKEVVALAGLEINAIQAVAVSAGPGSYTGLRIGASTAKGLCFALSVPLISVSTLQVMTIPVLASVVSSNSLLCPMIDARRMEVYCQLFTAEGKELQPVEPKVIDDSSFSEWLAERKVLFFGNGASKCEAVIRHSNAVFVKNIYPSAVNMGAIAWARFQKNEFENIVQFEPFYLKDFMIRKPKGEGVTNKTEH